MAHPARSFLRLLVPLVLLAVGVAIGYSMLKGKGSSGTPAKPPAPPPAASQPVASNPSPPAPAPAPAPTDPAKAPAPTTPPPQTPPPSAPAIGAAAQPLLGALSAQVVPDATPLSPLGSVEPDPRKNPFQMQLDFTDGGAGIASLRLARQFQSIAKGSPPEVLQQTESHEYIVYDTQGNIIERYTRSLVPFALLGLTIEGAFVPLSDTSRGRVWRQTAPGAFEAVIADDQARPVARVWRRYTLKPARFAFDLEQAVENLSGRDLRITWHQVGPGDLPMGIVRAGGDVRRLRIGFLQGPATNPDGQVVTSNRHLIPRATALGHPLDALGGNWTEFGLWPQPETAAEDLRLSWVAFTNRYFAVAAFAPRSGPAAAKRPDGLPDKSFRLIESPRGPEVSVSFVNGSRIAGILTERTSDKLSLRVGDRTTQYSMADIAQVQYPVDRIVLARGGTDTSAITAAAALALRFTSPELTVKPGASADASMGVYAGPVTHAVIDQDPELVDAGLGGVVIYTYGGPCGFCTFQPITHFLRWFLGALHDYIVFDWALAVMVLVVCVRTILHPVTRWSQTNLQRFSKQMAALGPKQQKLREKYADDPKKLREEVGKLMREENISYAGALGCLPMFLQTPIWIALYAMISFTFELRHEGGFFGVFQAISGGEWAFLGDLSEPDNFIPLGNSFNIPLLSALMGPISSLNILPLILGVVFYIQQKYLSPAPAATLTPEQQSQQRIMKVMMVVMFPVFMYNSPSALCLYFLVNSTLGILESRWIRRHVEEEDKRIAALGPRAKAPAKPGFWARLQEQVAARQKLLEENRKLKEREQRGRKR